MNASYYVRVAKRQRRADRLLARTSFWSDLVEQIGQRLPDAKVYLFGSYYANQTRPDSDVDILISTKRGLSLEERVTVRTEVRQRFPDPRLELHFAGPNDLGQYQEFIKGNWRELP